MDKDYKSFEEELESITNSLDEKIPKKKVGFWKGPQGSFLVGYLSSLLTMGLIDYSVNKESLPQSLVGEGSIHWYIALGVGCIFASYRFFELSRGNKNECVDDVLDLEKTSSLFEDLVNGKSGLSEKSQKLLIMNQFWSTVPEESRKSIGELHYLVLNDGWDKKSSKEMLNIYLPLIEYNQGNN